MFCKKCGKAMDNDLTYCPLCGANQKGGPDMPPSPSYGGGQGSAQSYGGGQGSAQSYGGPSDGGYIGKASLHPQKAPAAPLTKPEKIAAIIKAGLFLFFAIWMLITPALSMIRESTLGIVSDKVTGYNTFSLGSYLVGGIEGALIVSVFCMLIAFAMLTFGVLALVGAIKGKKKFSLTMHIFIIFAVLLTLAYMIGSLVLRSSYLSSVESSLSGYTRIGSGSIAGFIIAALLLAAYEVVDVSVKAAAKSIERSKQNRPQPAPQGYQGYAPPQQNNYVPPQNPYMQNNYASRPPDVSPAPAQGTPAQALDVTAELVKYKKLLDDGILTQEEFDAKKKDLLGL